MNKLDKTNYFLLLFTAVSLFFLSLIGFFSTYRTVRSFETQRAKARAKRKVRCYLLKVSSPNCRLRVNLITISLLGIQTFFYLLALLNALGIFWRLLISPEFPEKKEEGGVFQKLFSMIGNSTTLVFLTLVLGVLFYSQHFLNLLLTSDMELFSFFLKMGQLTGAGDIDKLQDDRFFVVVFAGMAFLLWWSLVIHFLTRKCVESLQYFRNYTRRHSLLAVKDITMETAFEPPVTTFEPVIEEMEEDKMGGEMEVLEE